MKFTSRLYTDVANFCKQNAVFLLTVLYLILSASLTLVLASNEYDTFATAKKLLDADFAPTDWYLGLPTGYRTLFNFFCGLFTKVMPFSAASISLRIITYLLFGLLFQKLFRHFKISPLYLILFLFFARKFDTIQAGEWITKFAESKVFAYLALISALFCLLRKKYTEMFLLQGVALSFHVLVGVYSTVTLFITYLIMIADYKDDFWPMLKRLPLFFISGGVGLYTIVKTLLENSSSELVAGGVEHVHRNAHHLLYTSWPGYEWKIRLLVFIVILLAMLYVHRKSQLRAFAIYALSSLLFWLIAFILTHTGKIYLLKYYWFRLGDTLLPFFSFFLLAATLSQLVAKNRFLQEGSWRRVYLALLIVLNVVMLGTYSISFVKKAALLVERPWAFFYEKKLAKRKELYDAMVWARENSPHDAIFLTSPVYIYFYLIAERGVVATYKHNPQSEKDMVEWKKRTKLIAGCHTFNKKQIENVLSHYHADFFLAPLQESLDYPLVYKNKKYGIYQLR